MRVGVNLDQKDLTLREAVEHFEKRFLERMLERYRWNRTQTAAKLDIEPRTLRRKIKKYRLV